MYFMSENIDQVICILFEIFFVLFRGNIPQSLWTFESSGILRGVDLGQV
jgi:hypothetical protein